MLQQIVHRNNILRQLGKSMYGKIAVFDDGDELPVIWVTTSGRLVVIYGKGYASFDLSRVKYIKSS